ncbi:two-partner secretion domain-containing protein [Nostoc sp. 'Lobaria pulmonaria (5183) cyanobiont']|uniref:two-partner secretion domain-containing protein n=1 Tax=Nostoc sp. 'Lobaria pulmonaria (5183) cyanobiont' TaxID=1618022 RepID=UPI000CF35AEE|nr:filamentous hemagglutinin N-terminal domain-containing protein [Nostoc sp. 'Lobaria pulmonaria (5183) cyanobiont']AVH71561.1 filamentous hemagglutinin family outer membrane protein [Nostoc sp. 'Lobaria pulmonaria (5183) cyanobiont']
MSFECFRGLGIASTYPRCASLIAQALTCQFAGAIILSANCAIAQITPDATLPNNSNVKLNGNTTIIEGGTQTGSNLFHSFSEFSVPINGTAFFNNALDVQNIISRVTGRQRSDINGKIQANGIANLFLINPNGIVFGPTGSLSIGGSFAATTANALQFGSLGSFSATNPEAPSPLLTINPSAFLYNQIPTGAIENYSVAAAGLHLANFETFGLRVPDGKSLLLIGGNVTMDHGQLNAYGGRIELAGLSAPGSINLAIDGNIFSTQVPELSRSDVVLNNGAIANVAYGSGGSIAINARNIDLLKGSSLNGGIEGSLGSATAKAGNITLGATEAIKIEEQSEIRNQIRPNGIGNAGDINITTGLLSVKEGSGIYTRSLGDRPLGQPANAGNININARKEVSFLDGSFGSTTLESTGVGKSGDLQIQADSVLVGNDSQLNVSTLGTGDSGNLTIDARNTVDFYNRSFAFSRVEKGEGNGGIIKINTGSLTLTNNSILDASTIAKGNAGSVKIQARDNVSFANNSRAVTTVQGGGKGNGNDLSIQARSVSVTDGSFLTAGTFGEGNAGNVIIDATDSVRFDGSNSYAASSVGLEGYGEGLGNAGIVKISTGSLQLTNQAKLTAESYSKQGNAGDIIIDARDTVSLSDGSSLKSLLGEQIKGKAGNISITTGSLSVASGSSLQADTYGQGDGGYIDIKARDNVSFLTEGGAYTRVQLGANGKGGNIDITADSLTLSDGSFLAASTLGQGNSGSVTINAANAVNLSGVNKEGFPGGIYSEVATIQPNSNGGNVNITARSLKVTDGARLATSTNGNGNAGSVNINATDFVLFDGVSSNNKRSGAYSLVLPQGTGAANDININTGSLFLRNGASLSAGTEGEGNAGKINLTAQDMVSIDGASANGLPSTIESKVAENAVGNGGDVDVTTRSLFITNGAELSSSSQGNGAAGNLTVNANLISLDNRGKISADTIAGQGNINLNPRDLLIMRRNSEITTKASGNNITGGNITIDGKNAFVVAVEDENSNIRADSENFRGGNVTINVAQIFGFQSPTTSFPLISSITATGASPDLGGNIQINTFDTDPSKGLVSLTTDVVDVARLVDDNVCARTAKSSFTYTGSGGLPPSPNNTLNSDAVWEDWRLTAVPKGREGEKDKGNLQSLVGIKGENNSSRPTQIVEAQGWIINQNGEVILTAYAPTATPHKVGSSSSGCQSPIAN